MDSLSAKELEENHAVAILVLVMFLILFFIYCCWGSSCLRKLSSRMALCRQEDNIVSPSFRNIDIHQSASSPTIILLPHGRLLIVDGTVFARFNANDTGLDLLELRSHLLHEERNRSPRSPNIVEADLETGIKEPTSRAESQLPPSYDSIFSNGETNSPPSYSEVLVGTFPQGSRDLENSRERITV